MLKFVGTGSAFNTKLGNNSAYIKEGNKLFLIDCGSANFHRMKESGLLDDVEYIHVAITHTHADHIGSLADLIFYMYYMKGEHKARVTVYSPITPIQTKELLEINGIEPNQVNYNLDSGWKKLEDFEVEFGFGDLDFIEHVDNLRSVGYMIELSKDNFIFYSGDTKSIDKVDIDMLEEGVYKYFYIDTCSQDYEGNVHLSLKKLTELIKPEYRHKVWCMHLDEKFDVEYAKSLGFNVAEVEM